MEDVIENKGYVYDANKPWKKIDGKKIFNAGFDRARAAKLGLSNDEIEANEKNPKVILIIEKDK